jgi:sugar lactone lactonase YvrE
MNAVKLVAAGCAFLVTTAWADDRHRFPQNATFTTQEQAVTPLAIEGLTADADGNLYTTGRAARPTPCPVWRFTGASRVVVGFLPNPNEAPACNPSGIAFDGMGKLYIADGDNEKVWKLAPDASSPPTATAYVTGVPGTNGLAFDRDSNLWTGDGTRGQGRVWKIDPAEGERVCEPSSSAVRCVEAFRIQPMRNSAALGGDIAGDGVGRQARTFPPGTLSVPAGTALPHTPAGGQDLVANGVAFDRDGDLYVADTARGAIWKVELDRHGGVRSRMNCDTTFTENTLCLDAVFVAHPYLEGTDGIALDRAGNIWNSANERNAIVVVTRDGDVIEIFRNPPNSAGLRNSADTAAGNTRILEFPTSPVLVGRKFCTSNSDGDRRDNSPRAAGEINGGAGSARGKISCMDQALSIPGLPLPVR